MKNKSIILPIAFLLVNFLIAQDKPNILVIWGDDIGWSNVGFNNNGLMGYKTPNIDRIANEGAVFTDWYGQQSCTAGRAAFILGQHPFRTGLLTIGMPGDKHGIEASQPTIADLLKPQGYATGQFGKNHLGDQDEHLPTNHGFDEFFGNLYHLNAEEEPEGYYYPKDPDFRKKFGPRGVIHSTADGKIEDTGPLTKQRMETVDEEFEDAAIKFIEKAHADGKPFFVWLSATRMHIWTHLKEESQGVTGIGIYPDGMVEHDKAVGRILDKLDELGITDNTIVMYSTDNGAEKVTWPDGGSTPFRGEKGTTWEGGFRVPCAIRWPGVIKPGTVYNDIFSHEDMMPTLVAAAGEPNIKEKVLKGYSANGKTFKQHLDGYNFLPYLKGEVKEAPRKEIFYFDAGGNLNAIRYEMWKVHFTIMEGDISQAYRKSPSWPLIVNLRADPYEVSPDARMYVRWYGENMWLFVPAQRYAAEFLSTFKEFPPQTGSSLSIDKVVQQLASPPRN
ncbi:arylsulfatase [Galbibacter pacificus]|uniref:Arylsulfatase n=1 Tax=Galbibacter pacificus TaxID=2996052 RepID=A0ABT6FVB7_9FLAO|nr:arylsulfatase [Galbibacter pacificus]MDG3583875.1 arylsulfatase [Galbibacter pacificus]MDG3587207.1 arylsulfatase [Galbibacter pacificus]